MQIRKIRYRQSPKGFYKKYGIWLSAAVSFFLPLFGAQVS